MQDVAFGVLGFLSGITLVLLFQLTVKVGDLQRHVGLLLKHNGIDLSNPPQVSDRVKELARDPARKIEAIKLLREETGAGLAEAKRVVEDIARNSGV